MEFNTIQVGTFEVNCSLLEIDKQAWIIDPGNESVRILALLAKKNLAPGGILLTHAHFDHIGAIPDLQRAYPSLPVFVHPNDIPAFSHPMNQLPPDYPAIGKPKNVREIRNEKLGTGISRSLQIIETPGHTPGGVCYYFPSTSSTQPPTLFSGDTLFAGSIGRTDLPGGDMATLMQSLEKLKALPRETIVVPGHGMFTTIGDEINGNPFFVE